MTPTRAPAAHATLGFLLLCGALSTFPPVTTDIYLPALPQLTRSLHGTTAEGQTTLAVYFLGLGLGQLFYGPWSDRVGRRPPMLAGAAIYLAASFGCAVAGSMGWMIGFRFAQALGACSGVVISSAIVRDRFDHQESAKIYSMLLTLRGIGPILAPLAGGFIVTFFDWRTIFWALAAFGALIGVGVFFGMPESRTAAVAERARTESPLRAYAAVLRNPTIVGYILTNGFNFSSMFAWIAAAPYLVIGVYKVPALYFGWIFGANAAGFMAASQINRRLLRRFAPDRLMAWGSMGALASAAVLFLDAATGLGGPWGIFAPLFLVVSSLGFVSTNAMAGGLAVDPSRSGAVSALFGVGQFALGGLATAIGALASKSPALAMSGVILVLAAGAVVFPLIRLSRSRRAQAAG